MRYLAVFAIAIFFTPTTSAAAPAPEVFGTLPTVYDAAISPDGKQIASIVNIRGEYGVRVITVGKQDEQLRAVLLGKGVKPSWIKWANNDRVLVAMWQSQVYNRVPISTSFIFTLDASKMEGKILVKARDILRQDNSEVVDFLESDPDHILMAFSDDNQFLSDIQRVNVATGRYLKIEHARSAVQYWHTDRRGEPRIGQGLRDRKSGQEVWNLIIRDVDEDEWRKVDEFPGLRADISIFGFTDDPNELIIGDRAGRSTLGLYVYNLEDKEVTRQLFHDDTYDASGLVVSSDGEVIGARYVADTAETELFDEYDTVLERMRKRFPDYTVDYIDQAQQAGLVLFKVSNSYDAGALAIVDANTNEVDILAFYRKDLPSEEMGLVSAIRYPTRDGSSIPAYLTLPPAITDGSQVRQLPFVVLPHGGPYARTAKRFDYFAQFFATRGFAVLQMNFRGSAGYGEDFENAGRQNWVLMQDDVEDGTRWLIEEGYADPDRICIVGWSYGGYAALMGAIKNPELYACAVSMAGVTDLKDMITDLKKYRFGNIAARNSILSGFDDKHEMAENSPVKRAEEFTVPLFLAHGERDQRVHFDQYKRMKSALKKSPADVTFLEFEDEDHFLSSQPNRQQFFIGLDEFLRSTVGESEFAR